MSYACLSTNCFQEVVIPTIYIYIYIYIYMYIYTHKVTDLFYFASFRISALNVSFYVNFVDDDPMKAIAYNKIDDLDAEMEKQLSGNDSDDGKDGSDKESARGSLSLIVAKKKGINEKVSQMSQQHTLALIYLGLLWLNEPVSLNDLVR